MTIRMPTAMRNRWHHRAEPPIGSGTVYWHALMRDHPGVVEAADEAQGRLADFSGLHRTPREWLHMTVYEAGSTEEIGSEHLPALLGRAQEGLKGQQPVPVTTRDVLYHPEAIMLAIEPRDRLRAIAELVVAATEEIAGTRPDVIERIRSWIPHVTVAYSTAVQDSGPIVGALGASVRPRSAVIERIALVNQWGPERDWDWEVVGEIRLGGNGTDTT